MYAYENIYMHMFTNESSISCLVSNVSLPQIPSRPWITLEIEETRVTIRCYRPDRPESQTRYMNRHCILWTYVVRDLKYRHTKKITDFSAYSTFNKGELGN